MKRQTASDIANFFIASFQEKGKGISNLKLQKLLYYAQAWHLALYDAPLFDDKIEAWVHGPVVPLVFREYKRYAWRPIKENVQVDITTDVRFHLTEVIRVYGEFDAATLERMTHREGPWKETRGMLSPDEPSTRVITQESIKKYFSARLNE
jgi:uncharacterized phage-associated protein